MNVKRKLAHVAGVLVVLAVIFWITRPSPHVPPYDANLVRLAEVERQGYCAGVTFWRTGGEGDADMAYDCRQEHLDEGGEVDMLRTERGFCRGIVDEGWEGSVQDCLSIMGQFQYWPTFDGSITDQWNRARPYPRPIITGAESGTSDDSRTGVRPEGPGHNGYDRSAP